MRYLPSKVNARLNNSRVQNGDIEQVIALHYHPDNYRESTRPLTTVQSPVAITDEFNIYSKRSKILAGGFASITRHSSSEIEERNFISGSEMGMVLYLLAISMI